MRLGQKYCTAGVLGVFLFAGHASSQTATSGALSGVVVDQIGAVLPSAVLEITDFAKGTTDSAKTDTLGVYQFSFLRPGRYTLTIEHAGFQTERRSVTIQVGPPATVNITLQVAKTSTEIAVADEAPLIQAESADVSVTMNQKQVSEVPNPGNDLTYIAQTTPGAIMNTDGGWGSKFSILGMPGFSYGFTVDGMDITNNFLNNVRGGPLGLTLGTNQTEEATVVTSTYSGQFGGAAGGNINYVTKSGSNAFHGNAQYYWNGRVLNANDWFIKADGNPRPFSIANQWAGSLGGPIRKDRLFFFFDTEGLRLIIPQVLNTQIPTPEFEGATLKHIQNKFGPGSASDLFYQNIFKLYDNTPNAALARPGGFLGDNDLGCADFKGLGPGVHCARTIINTRSRPSQDTLTSGRVDWNISQNDRAFLRVQEEGGVGALNDDPISPVFDSELDNWRWQGQLLETHVFSPATAGQFLVGGSDHYWSYRASHLAEALSAFPTFLGFWVPGTFTGLGGFNDFGDGFAETRTFLVSADLTSIKGSHKLSFGAKLDREHGLEGGTVNANGQLLPQTMQAFYEGGFDSSSSDVDSTTLQKDFNQRPNPSYIYSGIQAYVQDEWRARKNLVLTLAIRVEHRANFSCETYCFSRLTAPFEEISHDPAQPYNKVLLKGQKHALSDLDPISWSPRLGVAWQPFGVSHNSILRGGAGVLYDPFQEALAEAFWINPPSYNSFTIFGNNLTPGETQQGGNLFQDAKDSNNAFVDGYKNGATLADLQKAIPNFFPPSLSSTERRMHRPQYQRWSLEWEQGLGAKTSVSLGYVGHHGIHELVGDPNVNAYGFGSLPAGQCSSPPVPPCSDPRFSGVTQWSTRAVSNYNGMVATFRHQFSGGGGGLVHVNYTYGHALDEVSNSGLQSFTAGSSLAPQDPSNLRGAYGPAEYDVRHSMNANYVWELPLKSIFRGHGPSVLLKGWQVSGTFFARTGFPYTVFDLGRSGNLRQNNYFGLFYSVPVGPLPNNSACGREAAFERNIRPCLPPQFFVQNDGTSVPNPNALFVQATCETDFNAGHLPSATDPCGGPVVSFAQGRNRFRGPSYFNTDFAVMKSTKIPGLENGTFALGLQFFNVLNHTNFGTPDNSSSDSVFGLIFWSEQSPSSILGNGLNAATAARMIQIRAELRF
jgi:Carboxypeptidase regulatory-like domain